MTTFTETELTAAHEAAHAVVAHVNGLKVTSVEITKNGTGLCMMAGNAGQETKLALAMVAGYVVETMLVNEARKSEVQFNAVTFRTTHRYGVDAQNARQVFTTDAAIENAMNTVRGQLLANWNLLEDVAFEVEDKGAVKGLKLNKLLNG